MATFADCAARQFARMVGECWPAYGMTGTVTTFTQYRRATTGPVSDLGTPNAPWAVLRSDVVCTWLGIKPNVEGGFQIAEQGQIQNPIYEAFTTKLDIVEGDEIVVALDGKAYQVDRTARMGPVLHLLLKHSLAQIEP